jgi:hypothetical protein
MWQALTSNRGGPPCYKLLLDNDLRSVVVWIVVVIVFDIVVDIVVDIVDIIRCFGCQEATLEIWIKEYPLIPQ